MQFIANTRRTAGKQTAIKVLDINQETIPMWDFSILEWVEEETASCSFELIELVDGSLTSNYRGAVNLPTGGPWKIEYYDGETGKYLASEMTPTPTNIVIPAVNSNSAVVDLVNHEAYKIKRGDSKTFIFSLGGNYTGWTVRFGGKKKASDVGYVIEPRIVDWVDESIGTGVINLTGLDTGSVGTIYAELQVTSPDGNVKHTPTDYTLIIVQDYI